MKPTASRVALVPVLAAALIGFYFAATRQRSARATPAQGQQGSTITKRDVVQNNGKVAESPVKDTPNVIAGGAMKSIRAEMTPRGLHVTAQAHIHDRRPGSRFFWGVRVRPAGQRDVCVFEKIDNQHMFKLDDNHQADPMFEDTFNFPVDSGKYIAEVIVFTVPPGMDLSRFDEPEYEQTYRFVGGGSNRFIIP